MRKVRLLPRFKRDFRRLKRVLPRHVLDYETFEYAVELLAESGRLPESFREHALRDELAGLTEFHLDADWLLVYRVTADEVVLHRTGTHRDVFVRERHPVLSNSQREN